MEAFFMLRLTLLSVNPIFILLHHFPVSVRLLKHRSTPLKVLEYAAYVLKSYKSLYFIEESHLFENSPALLNNNLLKKQFFSQILGSLEIYSYICKRIVICSLTKTNK